MVNYDFVFLFVSILGQVTSLFQNQLKDITNKSATIVNNDCINIKESHNEKDLIFHIIHKSKTLDYQSNKTLIIKNTRQQS